MHQIMNMMAAMMPEEQIIEDMKDALIEYSVCPVDQKKQVQHKIEMMCILFLSKRAIEISGGDFNAMMKMNREMEEIEKLKEMLNPNKQ